MIAYKFLRAGAVGPFTGHRWSPGTWVEAADAHEGLGIHACRVSDLSFWICDELWRVELQGHVWERATQIEARRGRLLDQVAGWDEKARSEFGLHCVFQTRDIAASALRGLGFADLADRLAAASTLSDLAATVRSIEPPDGFAAEMFGYARDAAMAFSMTGNAAESSFIASVANAAARGDPAGFGEEKRRQSHWLAKRLMAPEA
ncbi:MAG TPA: hypothetical protein VE755_02335 [Myxococcales bacterium]|jgi:hypothetical protein|nr:hypothetical protein [Myxococcales bacterium]